MPSTNLKKNSSKSGNELISYASSFASFFIAHADLKKVRDILLFGSVARMEAGTKSDVDIFIDGTISEEEAEKLLDRFYETEEYRKWKLLGVENDIKVMAGNLKEWELYDSVVADGIVLYGPYRKMPSNTRAMVLFSWEEIKPNANRVLFNKRLFGFNHYGKRYKGILETYDGKKIGKGAVLVPKKHYKEVLDLLRKHKVSCRMREVLEVMP